jgi:hypothetical protein
VLRVFGGGERCPHLLKRLWDYELIHFSNYDLERSILRRGRPQDVPAQDPSTAAKRKLTSEIRSRSLRGYGPGTPATTMRVKRPQRRHRLLPCPGLCRMNNLNLLKPIDSSDRVSQVAGDAASPSLHLHGATESLQPLFRPEGCASA